MGNAQTQQAYITQEYSRVSKLGPLPLPPDSVIEAEYIVLDQVLLLQPPRENPLDFSHLGTLYVLDSLDGTLNGRFYLQDLLSFSELYSCQVAQVRTAGATLGMTMGSSDFQSKFQAYCTLQMWSDLSTPPEPPKNIPHPMHQNNSSTASNGKNKVTSITTTATSTNPIDIDGARRFGEWFSRLFSENGAVTTFEGFPGQTFLSVGTVKTMHQLLGIKKMYGLDFQGFFDLLQRVAEEKSLMILQDVTMDDVVPKVVVDAFAQDFIQGFMKLMSELGFEPGMVVDPIDA